MAEHAPINPVMLSWARERAGYSVDALAGKLGVAPKKVAAWEAGTRPVAVSTLNRLVSTLKRPSAFFYMPAPPEEPETSAPDFRDHAPGIGPALRLQLRVAKERRDAALNLLAEVGGRAATFAFTCERQEDVEGAGARLRAALGTSLEQQADWGKESGGYTVVNGWRAAAETAGLLVFQAPKRDLEGARGFSVVFDPLPVIVLSSEDSPVGRAFTLVHEAAHVGLRQGGVCDFHDDGVERFCNRVGAAALMPGAALLAAAKEVGHRRKDDLDDSMLKALARRFGVSEQALVLRLETLRLVSRDFYEARHAKYAARSPRPKGDVKIPPHVKAIAYNGRAFTRIVLDAYHREVISQYKAATYLHVGFEHVPKIEHDMAKPRVSPKAS